MNIYVVGYPAAGKTTYGAELAERIGYRHVDLDDLIARAEGATIAEIFRHRGEAGFRAAEQEQLRRTFLMDRTVVSTGGGTPCYADNMDQMLSHGLTVYLRVPAAELARRLRQCRATRPRLAGVPEAELLRHIRRELVERERYYCRAHITAVQNE